MASEILFGIEELELEVSNSDIYAVTPVEELEHHMVKRDDHFSAYGAKGGKARTCLYLCQRGIREGLGGLVTAGSKQSPQIQIVSFIAKELGVPFHAHTPQGELGVELEIAKENGATIHQHRAGYNNVIIKRARDMASELGYLEVPFGMECWEAVYMTAVQVSSLRGIYESGKLKRIVIPVGSGMSVAGVLWGLVYYGFEGIEVLGVRVGADPTKRLGKYAPSSELLAERGITFTMVNSELDYHTYYPEPYLEGVELDPIYEAKCLDFISKGDLLWVVGIRET